MIETERALAGLDAVVMPTSPVPATPIEAQPARARHAAAAQHACRSTCWGCRRSRCPCGFTAGGLPIGLQIVGKAFDEAGILRIAQAYEQATDWHRRRPAL